MGCGRGTERHSAVDVGQNPPGVRDQSGRGMYRLRTDGGGKSRRTVIGVDQAVDMPAQPQTEREVPVDQTGGTGQRSAQMLSEERDGAVP